jgi:enoyl-CoA hydratase
MLTDLDKVQSQATEIAGMLAQLPGHAYHGNKMAIRGATIDRIKAKMV